MAQITTKLRADLSPVTHYVATEETDLEGQHYLEWLIMDEPIHYYRSLQVDAASIKLQNVDGAVEALLALEYWEGAAIVLWDFFTNMGEELTERVELVRGVLTRRAATEEVCSWDIVPDWDAQTIQAPARQVTRACPWRFKGAACGYTGTDFTTCDKTFAACTARAQTHRFGGFIQVSQKLATVYQPAAQVFESVGEGWWAGKGIRPY